MLNDTLANALSVINNYDKAGKRTCLVNPASKLMKKVLDVLNSEGYIGSYETLTEARGVVLKVNLLGKINKCCVIKPRSSVKSGEFEKFEKRYLPAKGVGCLVVSTSKGIFTHEEAKKKSVGGRLLAYCY